MPLTVAASITIESFLTAIWSSRFGIYWNAQDGHCEKCMIMEDTWKERVFDEIVVYNSGDLEVEFRRS